MNPENNPCIQTVIRIATKIQSFFSLAHCQPSLKISCKSVREFLRKVANRQTDKQTDKQRRKPSLLGGGNYWACLSLIHGVICRPILSMLSLYFAVMRKTDRTLSYVMNSPWLWRSMTQWRRLQRRRSARWRPVVHSLEDRWSPIGNR